MIFFYMEVLKTLVLLWEVVHSRKVVEHYQVKLNN